MSGAGSGYSTAAADEWGRLLATRAPGWAILVRLLVGLGGVYAGRYSEARISRPPRSRPLRDIGIPYFYD